MRAMRSNMAMGVVVVSALVGLGDTALGGVIYDNGSVPDVAGGTAWYFAQSPGNGFVSTEFADDFVLEEGASTIRDIHWYGDVFGFNLVDELDSFTVTIYATALGGLAPGVVVTVAQITSIDRQDVVLANTADTYLYSARVEDIVLEPGVRYWLGISGDSGSADAPWGWRSTDAGNGVRGWSRMGGTGQFEPIGNEFASGEAAFYLTDDVPAPGALGVMGVAGVIGVGRRRRRLAGATAAAALGWVGAAAGVSQAGVIYDNGGVPDAGFSEWFFAQSPGNGINNTEYADDFVLADGASTIRDIHWYGDPLGFEPVGELDSFTLTIYATAAGALVPGAVVTVAQITSIERQDVVLNTSDTYLYSAVVEDIVLEPGVRYWLGISGDSGVAGVPWSWRGRGEISQGAGGWGRKADTGAFGFMGNDVAFYLTDDIPAPGALALAGVVELAGARRRRFG